MEQGSVGGFKTGLFQKHDRFLTLGEGERVLLVRLMVSTLGKANGKYSRYFIYVM